MKIVTATKKVQTAFRETVREYRMLVPGDRVLCGLSGGADSVALLHLLLLLGREYPFEVFAVHVHHGIRGAEADRDEAFCKQLCREYGVSLHCEHADAPGYAAESGKNLEDAARCLRYDIFRKIRAEADIDRIALAHHADDNLETVLLNLTRGSGLAGIRGIPPVRGSIIRPLLACKKADIAGYCEENGLSYVTDSTNADPSYARNFIRSSIVPLLEKLNPEVQQAFCQTSAIARADDEALWLEAEAHSLSDGRKQLSALPDAVLDRVLLREYRRFLADSRAGADAVRPDTAVSDAEWSKVYTGSVEKHSRTEAASSVPEPNGAAFSASGAPAEACSASVRTVSAQDSRLPALTGRQTAALRRIIRKESAHAKISLPGSVSLICDRDAAAFFHSPASAPEFAPYRLQFGANPSPDGHSVLFLTEADSNPPKALPEEIKAFKNIYKFFIHTKINPAKIRGTITVRTRCGGDTYRIRNQTKRVKKLLQSLKLPAGRTAMLPILCDEEGILWIPGFPPRDGCAAEDGKTLFLYYFA